MIRELVVEGTTVLLTTQYLEEADRLADRVAVVDGGQVIADDTPARLKSRLGSTVVEMGFADQPTASRAFDLLRGRLPDPMDLEDHTLRLTSDGGAHVLVEVLRLLDSSGIEPSALGVREPSLDDVFLAITGHHADPRDGGDAPQPIGAAG
jgi:ABC-type multidrug transport system ATPase subunit